LGLDLLLAGLESLFEGVFGESLVMMEEEGMETRRDEIFGVLVGVSHVTGAADPSADQIRSRLGD
jgi:hypothetical protein